LFYPIPFIFCSGASQLIGVIHATVWHLLDGLLIRNPFRRKTKLVSDGQGDFAAVCELTQELT
jgi:hypothetical protein